MTFSLHSERYSPWLTNWNRINNMHLKALTMKKKRIIIVAAFFCGLLPTVTFGDNVITRWNEQALDTVRTERLGAAPASRLYAIVNIAMYDAVNGIDRAKNKSRREHAIVSPRRAPSRADRTAAAAAAAHTVLLALYPNLYVNYDTQLHTDLQTLDNKYRNRGIDEGVEWGTSVGNTVVEIRSTDGSFPQEILVGGDGPGEFRADFTSAQYRNMTPFAIADKAAYVSDGPPGLASPEYLAAHHEVRLLGDANYINPLYDEIFRFWSGGGGSVRPPGEWIKIAMTVAEQEKTTDDLSATAHLFAMLGMAMGDTTISTWESKYVHHFWRPTTAINEAYSDGNTDTVSDSNWQPRNGSIGSSPEHTSGQSAYAGAGSTILAGFYCDNNIQFTFEGDDSIAGSRTFSSFSEAAAEAGQARIFAGIHFQFSNQAGQAAGRGVAREILSSALQSPDGNSCRHKHKKGS